MVYWVTDSVDMCSVGFNSWHLVKHRDEFDGALAQVMEVCSADDMSKQKRQNFVFAKAVLFSEVGNATKDSELDCDKVTTFKKAIHNNGVGRIIEVAYRKDEDYQIKHSTMKHWI